MFNFIKAFKKWRRARSYENDLARGLFFYESEGDFFTRVDPLETYIKIKEHGFDVFSEEIEGVLKGHPAKTRAFKEAMTEIFNVKDYDGEENKGVTVLDMLYVYFNFFYFLTSLKKNATFLQEYAPSLEARLLRLSNGLYGRVDSQAQSFSSGSTSTSSPQAPQEDSQVTTEQAGPGTE